MTNLPPDALDALEIAAATAEIFADELDVHGDARARTFRSTATRNRTLAHELRKVLGHAPHPG